MLLSKHKLSQHNNIKETILLLYTAKVITVEMYYCCEEGLTISVAILVFEFVIWMCLASTPFATPVSQTLHFSIVWTFPMCFFKIYAVWNFLSQMLQLDSFFWWYSLLCLLKRSGLLDSFPQSAHWFWMFIAQSQGYNWRVQQYSKQWVLSIFDRL